MNWYTCYLPLERFLEVAMENRTEWDLNPRYKYRCKIDCILDLRVNSTVVGINLCFQTVFKISVWHKE